MLENRWNPYVIELNNERRIKLTLNDLTLMWKQLLTFSAAQSSPEQGEKSKCEHDYELVVLGVRSLKACLVFHLYDVMGQLYLTSVRCFH